MQIVKTVTLTFEVDSPELADFDELGLEEILESLRGKPLPEGVHSVTLSID